MKEGTWHGAMLLTGVVIAGVAIYMVMRAQPQAATPAPPAQCSCGCDHSVPTNYIMG